MILFLDGPHAGRLLKHFDPDRFDGRGLVESTDALSDAIVFPDTVTAWETWKTPSSVHPVRLSDGKPNRPMTAWTITISPVASAPE